MEDLLLLEPRSDFDQYLVGVGNFKGNIALVYDKDKLIEHWMKEFTENHIPYEGAETLAEDDAYMMAIEWFEYNVIGAYLGEHTPIYVSKDDLELEMCEGEGLVFVEPRSEFDECIIGLGSGFGGAVALAYDKDKVFDIWKAKYKAEAGEPISDDDALLMAVEWFDHIVNDIDYGGHDPIYVSKDELDLFLGKYTIVPENA
jgi:hypothetical protein